MSIEALPRPRRLAVILGAGSSYDCADPRKNEVNPQFRPPLVQQLFEPRPGSFNGILNKYPKARALSSHILSKLERGTNLEAILLELQSDQNPTVKKLYWHIPLYLQELLGEVSVHYVTSGPTKFEELVFNLERSKYDELLYATLNYDLFMEAALTSIYGVQFRFLGDYFQEKWSFVKFHGSVNWGQAVTNRPEGGDNNSRLLLDRIDGDLKLNTEINVLSGYQENCRFNGNTFYYPALAVPVEGKAFFSCPEDFVQRTRDFFASCTDFLFIGFSARDQHVLNLLGQVKTVRKFVAINGDEKSSTDVCAAIAASNAAFKGPSYTGTLNMGLCDFVTSVQLEHFLNS